MTILLKLGILRALWRLSWWAEFGNSGEQVVLEVEAYPKFYNSRALSFSLLLFQRLTHLDGHTLRDLHARDQVTLNAAR